MVRERKEKGREKVRSESQNVKEEFALVNLYTFVKSIFYLLYFTYRCAVGAPGDCDDEIYADVHLTHCALQGIH